VVVPVPLPPGAGQFFADEPLRSPATDGPQPRHRRIWLSYGIAAFGLGANTQVTFLIPLRARELGATLDVIGLIIGAGAIAAVFTSVPSGALIDRLGPRRAFVAGTGVTTVLMLLTPWVTNYWFFLPLLALLGVARNLGWVASQAHITGIGSEKERPRLTGRFSLFSSVGQMVGPLMVGAAAGTMGYQWALVVPAAYALGFRVLGLCLVEVAQPPRGQAKPSQGVGVRSAWQLLAIPGIWVVLLLTFGRVWITVVYATFVPVYLVIDRDFDPFIVGTVTATSGLVAAAIAPTVGFWTRYASPATVTNVALTSGATGLILVPHVAALPYVFIVPVLVGVGLGITLPLLLSMTATEAPEGRRGVALGLRSTATQSAMAGAPLLVGAVMGLLGTLLGFTGAGIAGLAVLVGARLVARRASLSNPSG
jgi:MFS family permease